MNGAGIGNFMDFGERMHDARVARLNTSIDPMASQFPWQSPYVFAGNNPILFVDKEGGKIWLLDFDKTGDVIQRVEYRNGRLFDAGGKEIVTADKYINNIKSTLDNIKNISISAGNMITEMENQTYNHDIQNFDPTLYPKKDGNYNREMKDSKGSTITKYNSEDIMDISTPEATLAHELKHGYDRSKGQLRKGKLRSVENNPFVEAEWDATNVQNQILYNQNKPLRCNYGGIEIPVTEYVAPKDNDIPKSKVTDDSTIESPSSKNDAPAAKSGDVQLNTGSNFSRP